MDGLRDAAVPIATECEQNILRAFCRGGGGVADSSFAHVLSMTAIRFHVACVTSSSAV